MIFLSLTKAKLPFDCTFVNNNNNKKKYIEAPTEYLSVHMSCVF